MKQTLETLHPLAATFARLGKLSEYLKAELVTPTPDSAVGDRWIAPLHLFASASPKLAKMVDATERKLHTSLPNIVGSSLLQSYQWLVIGCAVGSFILDRRVPDLAAERVWVRFARSVEAAEGDESEEAERVAFGNRRFAALPGDPCANHPDAYILPDEDALRTYLRVSVETHFAPIIDHLHSGLGSGKRGLWLNVADRCASNFIWLMQEKDEAVGLTQIQQEVDRMIRVPGSPLQTKKVGVFELTFQDYTHCFLERATCCYWYKCDGSDYCSTCPHRPQEERKARLLDYMAEKHAEKHGTPTAAAAD
jgi:hypothetical protein